MKRFILVYSWLLTLTAHADESFFDHWLDNVTKTQDNQPHWMTPLVTITPRLEQEYRFDYLRTNTPNGATQETYGNFKGLEIIPSENTEIIISGPTYQSVTNAKGINTSGYADELFLLKYRLATANEEHGNYIVSAFLGATVPTGDTRFSNNHTVYTPTIAAGKGWGDREQGFDIQSTLAISLPAGGVSTLGKVMTFNTAFQGYFGKFWPEIETSFTHWYDGPRAGKSQMLMTYGATIGRFQIRNRMRVIVGLGYQTVQGTKDITVSDALISTVRLTF